VNAEMKRAGSLCCVCVLDAAERPASQTFLMKNAQRQQQQPLMQFIQRRADTLKISSVVL